jgi:outer membrane protein TolC
VGLQGADLAITLLRLREVEFAQIEAVDWIDRLALLMRGAVRAGVRSTTDSVRVALERNSAAAALEKTEFDERTAEIDLMALMGLEPDSTFEIRSGFPDRPPNTEDSIRIMASVSRQPEIGIARIAEERARLDILEAKRTTAPTVDLSLDAGLAGTDLTHAVPPDLLAEDPDATLADRLRRDLGASATINVRAPIRGSAARLSTQSKAIALRAAGLKSGGQRVTQQRIALEILTRWRSAYTRLVAARDATIGAERNLLRVKSLYSGGAILLLDLLDARRLYQDAVERHADALQESRSAQFRAEDRP